MAKISITAETIISTEIEIDRDGDVQAAILHLDGGHWYLSRLQEGSKWLASPRTEYPEALKRALIDMGIR